MYHYKFYQSSNENIDRNLCKLVEKIYLQGGRSLLKVPDLDSLGYINEILWKYSQKIFLPHGKDGDFSPTDHPIYISTSFANKNNAGYLIIFNHKETFCGSNYKNTIYVFNQGNKNIHYNLHKNFILSNKSSIFYCQDKNNWRILD